MTRDRIDKAKQQLKRGIPEGEIKNQLKSEGFTDEEIKRLFVSPKADMRSWYLVSAILVLLFALYCLSNTGGISLLLLALSGLLFHEYNKARVKKN